MNQPSQLNHHNAPQPPQTVVIKEKQGWGLGTRILLWLIAIVVVLAVIAVLTISVAVLEHADRELVPVHYLLPRIPA